MRPPAEGERAARRGYRHQDRASARLIYQALAERTLLWVGLADRRAGNVDDLVLGFRREVIAHQFKKALQPSGFGVVGLLLGSDPEIARLANAYTTLAADNVGTPVRIRFLTNDYPSTSDRLLPEDRSGTTANFLSEWAQVPRRSLEDWRASRWQPVIDNLAAASGLADDAFEAFWFQLELISGAAASACIEPGSDAERERQIEELSRVLGTLAADHETKDRWSRDELLAELAWPDRFALRFAHEFPVGAWVQSNTVSQDRLSAAVAASPQGYVSLVGPPGSGKSTLLARALRQTADLEILRYLAFVPGMAQGQGRGEADAFYHDLTSQLIASGLGASRLKDDTIHARREHFEMLLAKAGERYQNFGTRTLIIVDGLDHVPREEFPTQSLLTALPLPHAIPEGVLFVLGTQTLDLPGMPSAVGAQAGTGERQVEIARLRPGAISAMARAANLDTSVSRDDLYRVGGGHPLVTHYLIERLLRSDDAERNTLLGGEFGEGGDLEAVYHSAWRWIDQASDAAAIKKVFALIAHSQGAIEPELLARAAGEGAVEAGLKVGGHLLSVVPSGWSVFHNSFRLFIQRQRVMRFGKADPDFLPQAIYRRLGALVKYAGADSPQRWLAFRYAFLAGDHIEALTMATRAGFVGQYLDGRDRNAVVGDISDSYRLLEPAPDAAKLFELMLAQDEVERRASVLASASSMIDASLALGDIDSAMEALGDIDEEGKHWLLVDALLAQGRVDDARRLFEDSTPFKDLDSKSAMGLMGEFQRQVSEWIERAVLFLDLDQIGEEITLILDGADPDRIDQFKSHADEAVARVLMLKEPQRDLEALCLERKLNPLARIRVALDSAEAAWRRGDVDRAKDLLCLAVDARALAELHASWALAGGRVALRIGERSLAEMFLVRAPLTGPGDVGAHRSEELVASLHALIDGVVLRALLEIPVVEPTMPRERLLKGLQHHLVILAMALGEIRAGKPVTAHRVNQIATSALTFLADARPWWGDDDMVRYRLPTFGPVVLDLIYELCAAARLPGSGIASVVETLLDKGAVFGGWREFRRVNAQRLYDLDRDTEAAAQCLERALADLDCSDPRDEVQELSHLAECFVHVGRPERARTLLKGLRVAAYGVDRPAKKDGQYQLWVDVLGLANKADPDNRRHRAMVALNFVEGLQETEGSDMARRIVRQVLFEGAASDTATASKVSAWALEHGGVSWDGIVDALLKGALARGAINALDALCVWCDLALPWYEEPHGSTLEHGSFLSHLFVRAQPNGIEDLETRAADAILAIAKPSLRLRLMRVLETAATDRGAGQTARDAVARLVSMMPRDERTERDARNHPYTHLLNLGQAHEAIIAEKIHQRTRLGAESNAISTDGNSFDYDPSWNLKTAIARLVGASSWAQVESFAKQHPELMTDLSIALPAARIAVTANRTDAAEAFLATVVLDEDDGWSWPSTSRSLRRHEARQILGFPDAAAQARRELLGDLAAGRFGVAGILWSIEKIFPLLFSQVPWPELWELLEAQLRSTRDFARGGLLERLEKERAPTTEICEDQWLGEIFVEALTMDVVVLRDNAARCACSLLEQGNAGFFADLVNRLLATADGALAAANLLSSAAANGEIHKRFSHRLEELAKHGDLAVVAVAIFLAQSWNIPFQIEAVSLPALYDLVLPTRAGEGRAGERKVYAGGVPIDDPMGWTQNWVTEAERLAEAAEVSVEQVRRRVAQLIDGWGGNARFGPNGKAALQARLRRVHFELPFQLPHATAALRGLRHVGAELFHAGRIELDQMPVVLYSLYADPSHPRGPDLARRAENNGFMPISRFYDSQARLAWLDAVEDDLSASESGRVLASIEVTNYREPRAITMVAQTYRSSSSEGIEAKGIDATCANLPALVWLGAPMAMFKASEAHPSRVAQWWSPHYDRRPQATLVLCPYAARALGWSREWGTVDRFVSERGELMAWTEWWRDSLEQPCDEDEFRAEGQRVCLSEVGRAEFEAHFGAIRLSSAAWRRLEEAGGDQSDFRFAQRDAAPLDP